MIFELSKWYGDCISERGDVRIAYCAQVRYGRLKAHYSSLLDGEAVSHSLGPYRIVDEGQTLCWDAAGVSACWTRQDAALKETVFESNAGVVEWLCVMPKGSANINGVRGLGYAEHLRITIAPWKLPIRTLRWGRFLTPRTTLIWIDWQVGRTPWSGVPSGDDAPVGLRVMDATDFVGEQRVQEDPRGPGGPPHSIRIVFLNGRRVLAETLDDGGLLLDNEVRISFDRGQVLRQGSLGSTVFAAIPGIGRIASARMFRVEECKWKSRARMQAPGGPAEDGWCIHEVVNWP